MAKKQELGITSLLESGSVKKGSDPSLHYARISFGIPILDKLTGGGVPRKRMTLLRGMTNTGKSYLASQVVANAIRAGGKAAWIDTELSWDPDWMEKCGIKTDNVMVSQPATGEEAFDIIKVMLSSSVDVVVLDSIAGLVPTQLHEEGFSFNPMAWQARFVNSSLPRIFPYLKEGSAFIAINQLRSSIGPSAADNVPGGMAQSFFAHLTLETRREGWIEEDGKKVGFDMEVRSKKGKVGGEIYQSCVVPFRLAGGIDEVETFIREAISKDLIHHTRAWYKLTWNEEKVLGMNGLRQYFREHPEEIERIKNV